LLVGLLLLVGWWWWGNVGPPPEIEHRDDPSVSTKIDPPDPVSGLPWIQTAALPSEATRTIATIKADGPYPYPQDDSVFGNFEGRLPAKNSGYYREYTVPTPGNQSRGARRLVVGRGGEYYWTVDHYRSFRRIEDP